jgi:hypothetical protein
LKSVSATGHTVGSLAKMNTSSDTYVDWVFREAPKFFQVINFTSDGSYNQRVQHNLGVVPGMIIVRNHSIGQSWRVYHRSLGKDYGSELNNPNAAVFFADYWGTSEPTTTDFGIASAYFGAGTLTAYVFAHDTTADGIIQCGSFTTDGSGNATVNHGWSAGVQFAAIKASSTTGDWEMYDTARTSGWSGNDARLRANLPNAEDSVARLSASGASVTFAGLSASQTYVYVFVVAPT